MRKKLDKASDWAIRIGSIADDLCRQMSGRPIEFREQFLMGALSRQAMILQDISRLIKSNSERNMTSAFILFRCLLDDYLTILYLADANFDNERFIQHTAYSHSKRMSMTTESRKINERFFNGGNPDLATPAMEQQEKEDFKNEPGNGIYYRDEERTNMKGFITTSSIVSSLTVNQENMTAAHSFAVWKLLSNYVHYSHLTYWRFRVM
jgi:hypothetical protein